MNRPLRALEVLLSASVLFSSVQADPQAGHNVDFGRTTGRRTQSAGSLQRPMAAGEVFTISDRSKTDVRLVGDPEIFRQKVAVIGREIN